jgi:hypothetical protein
MMSGNQQATEQFYVQRFGADGFVKKPFGRGEVFLAIRALVQAGRMPARSEAAPADVIPDGMTAEEWNAIPDIGMPDDAHVASVSVGAATGPAETTRAAAGQATARVSPGISLGSTTLSDAAVSPALKPTLFSSAGAATPSIKVSAATPVQPTTTPVREDRN